MRKAAPLAALAATALTLSACAESERDGSGGGGGAEAFTFGAAGAPEVFDPFYATDGETFRITRQIFEPLVQVKPGSAEIGPALAEKWESSEDGKTWTFTLREGVKFTDGEAFNADAVCANFERMDNQNKAAQSGPAEYWRTAMGGFGDEDIYEGCEAKDDYTVDLTINRATSKFPALLSLASFGMQSPKALEEGNANEVKTQGEGFVYPENSENPVGTGPYVFTEYDEANKSVTITRNEDYWGDKAKTEKIVFEIIPDESTRRKELDAGGIDGYDLPNPVDWKGLEDNGNQVEVRDAFNVLYMAFNPKTNPKLQDAKVREAIQYAIDREGLVKSQLPEGAEAASQFMPEAVSGYNTDLEPYPHDTEKAKELLKEAGAEDLTLNFAYPSEVSRPYMPNPQKIHEALTKDLEEAGITVKTTTDPWNGGYLDNTDAGKYDAFLLGWTGDYDSADNFLGTFFGTASQNHFQTSATDFGEELAKSLAEADGTVDEAEREKAYQEINKKLAEEYMPGAPISHSPPALVVSDKVDGLVTSPLTAEEFSTVTVGGK